MCLAALVSLPKKSVHIVKLLLFYWSGTFYQRWAKQFATSNFLSFTSVLAELLQSMLLLGLDERNLDVPYFKIASLGYNQIPLVSCSLPSVTSSQHSNMF